MFDSRTVDQVVRRACKSLLGSFFSHLFGIGFGEIFGYLFVEVEKNFINSGGFSDICLCGIRSYFGSFRRRKSNKILALSGRL